MDASFLLKAIVAKGKRGGECTILCKYGLSGHGSVETVLSHAVHVLTRIRDSDRISSIGMKKRMHLHPHIHEPAVVQGKKLEQYRLVEATV
jgi:hypothetical protein